jgi:hypothetical protein
MRIKVTAIAVVLLFPLLAGAQQRVAYTWVDDDGIRHYGDSIPPEYADMPKDVINEHGVTIGHIRGRKTAEEAEAERVAAELALQQELQIRADGALLLTYQNVAEIEMHRDRKVKLYQAQSRVTELYLRNLDRRYRQLKEESLRYRPYSSDPSAPMIQPRLVREMKETESRIGRHQENLQKYQQDERNMIEQFNGDIHRFKSLKGIPVTAAQVVPE